VPQGIGRCPRRDNVTADGLASPGESTFVSTVGLNLRALGQTFDSDCREGWHHGPEPP